MMQPRRFDARQSQLGHGAISDMPMDKRPLSSIERRAACGGKAMRGRLSGRASVWSKRTIGKRCGLMVGGLSLINHRQITRHRHRAAAPGAAFAARRCASNCASIARLR
ncbi:hypothetical protein BURMUCGD1_1272 [Burkholderia multivorans CGD1]|nr:hypothetical protein BURMUCGD1_1272 [Burkholderia multivorans CGD1]